MKIFFISLFVLFSSACSIAQASYFAVSMNGDKIQTLVYLGYCPDGHWSGFQQLPNGLITYSSEQGAVIALDVANKRRFPYTYSRQQIRQFSTDTDYYYFIEMRDEDALIKLKEGRRKIIRQAPQLLGFDFLNADEVGVIEKNKAGNKKALVYQIDINKQKALSLRPGENVIATSSSTVSFIDIFSDDYRYIKSFDTSLNQASIVTRIPNTVSHFTTDGKGNYLIADEGLIKQFQYGTSINWQHYLTLTRFGISNPTRVWWTSPSTIIIEHEH